MKTKRLISAGFDARCADGSRRLRAAGSAPTPVFPNIFLTAAARCGTRSQTAASVSAAIIGGAGRRVCGALSGLRTMIGTPKKRTIKNFYVFL